MSEAEWQSTVLGMARAFKWRAVHIRNVRLANGRVVVPYEGDPGLPDLILARDGRTVLVELKTDDPGSRPSPGQRAWLAAAGGYVWRPADRAGVEAFLRDGPP